MTSSLLPRLFRASALAGLAVLAGSTVTACAQDQETLLIERAVWFTGPDACTLDVSGGTSLAGLTADVKFNTRIGVGLVITNNAFTNPASTTGLDDSEIQLQSVDVRLSFSGGGLSTSAFNVPLPTDSLNGGDTQSTLIQIPSDIAESMRDTMAALPPGSLEILEIEATVIARKTSQVGKSKLGELESRSYTFPLDICHGCLESCMEGCGGVEGLVCPTTDEWAGTCGFAQGGPVIHPSCAAG